MANEIGVTAELRCQNDPVNVSHAVAVQIDQTTAGAIQNKQTIATTGSTLSLAGVTAARYILIENQDAAHYVDIGPDSSGLVALARLQPGDAFLIPFKAGTTIKGIANTGNVVIGITLIET